MKWVRRRVVAGLVATVLGGRAWAQEHLRIDRAVLDRLAAIRREPKFGPATDGYVGWRSAPDRAVAEERLDALIDELIAKLPANPTKAFVLQRFASLLSSFDSADTEDRERVCDYLQRIMGAVGIASSDGLLNRWLYGFDPTKRPQ